MKFKKKVEIRTVVIHSVREGLQGGFAGGALILVWVVVTGMYIYIQMHGVVHEDLCVLF